MYHAVNQWFSSPNVNSFWQVLTSSVPAAPTPELPVRPRGLLEVAKHFQINRSSSFVFENAVFRFALISTRLLHTRSFVESCAHRNQTVSTGNQINPGSLQDMYRLPHHGRLWKDAHNPLVALNTLHCQRFTRLPAHITPV